MARTGRDGPTDRAWPAAVVLGLTLVAGASALALVWPMVFGPCPCRDPDGRPALVVATSRGLWVAVAAARYVASGALGFVYESTPALTALPLYPILLAPLVAAGDALGLSGPPAPAATLDLLLAPFTVGLAVPLLHQVGGLLRDAGDRAPALAAQAWTALLAVVPALVLYGHGEDAWPCSPWSAPSGWPGGGAGRRPGSPWGWRWRPSSGPCWPSRPWPPGPRGGSGPGWSRPPSPSRPPWPCSCSRWTGPMPRGPCSTRPTTRGSGTPRCGWTPGWPRWPRRSGAGRRRPARAPARAARPPRPGSGVLRPAAPSRSGWATQQSLGLHAPLLRARLAASVPSDQIGAPGGRLEQRVGQVPRRQPRR
jgi:hypothetical protein